MAKQKTKLTLRQKRLVEEMSDPKTKSVRQAALKAGYAKSTASVDVYKILEKPSVSEAIQQRIDRALKHHKVTPEEIIGSAVFQMRASLDDVINARGEPDLDKARANGAIDLIKELETKVSVDKDTGDKEYTYKIKMLTNQDGRKEVAAYAGVDETLQPQHSPETEAHSLYVYLLEKFVRDGMEKAERTRLEAKIKTRVAQQFPTVDMPKLLGDGS